MAHASSVGVEGSVDRLGGLSETFPWTLSEKTHNGEYIRWQHGMVPFFGGRSTLWSAWCPKPSEQEMTGWPQATIDAVDKYFDSATTLLNVVSTKEIATKEIDPDNFNIPTCGDQPIYGIMQKELTAILQEAVNKSPIENIYRVEPGLKI